MARSDYNLVNGRGSSILPSDARGHRNKSQGITWGMLLRNKRTWILIAVLFMFFYSANKFINGLDNEDEDLAIVGEVDVEIQDKTNSESTHQRSSFKTSSARDPVDVKKDEKQRQLQKERAAAEREKTSQLAKTDLGDPTKSKKVIIAPPTIPNAEFVEVDKKYIFWIEDTDVLPELKNGFKGKAADGSKRANACIMILAQDKDLDELRRTLRNFEDRFNRRFKYPYVFINDKAFSKGFKSYIRSIVSAPVEFGIIPKTMWGYPSWIDLDKAADTREKMKNIIYGSSESYRHMCRFFSGFATRHPLIAKYDFYWRVEPGVEFFCDITQDPFMEMQEKNQKYGFTITLHEYMDTIPTLWNHTIAYAHEKNLASNLLKFFVNDDGIYNGCHFWSNFEIAATSFMNVSCLGFPFF